MLDVILKSLPVFIAIALGKLFMAKKLLPPKAADVVSTITFKLVGPFFVFHVLYGISIKAEEVYLLTVPPIVFFISLVFAFLAGKYLLKFPPKKLGATILCLITFGPSAIYPLVDRNFPKETFQNFVFVDVLTFLIFLTAGSLVAINLGKKKTAGIKQAALKSLKEPFLATILLTFLVTILGIKLPQIVTETAQFFSGSFFLLAALLVGMTLKIPDRRLLKELLGVYLARVVFILGLIPLISLLFNLNRIQTKPLYLLYFAQYSVMAVIYAKEQDLDYEFASQLVLFSMITQLILYPILIAIL